MRWQGRERSENVEDRRGLSPRVVAAGGGGLVMLLLAGVALFLGVDAKMVQQFLGQVQQQQQAPAEPGGEAPGKDDAAREFLSVVLHDTESVWTKLFREELGSEYRPAKMVIFSDVVDSACGRATSQVGPFYCPADNQVYIDPAFFDQLAQRHQAPGDFAQAYVIAHEVAHHVQNQIGYAEAVQKIRLRGNEIAANKASVRLELQADFLAGVWAHHAHKEYEILEEGDLEEAITAANQIGDDTLMKEATGQVIPERFTHGTSAQRVQWFVRGLKSGKMKDCEELFKIPYESL